MPQSPFRSFVYRLTRQYAPKVGLRSNIWLVIPFILSPLSLAHAYLDPGSGSYIIQIVIGAIFGATYMVKGWIAKVVTAIRNRFNKKNKDDEQK